MSRAARTLFVWSFYLLGLGIILVVVPNFLLALFGLPTTEEVWVRVVGVLVLILAYYSLSSARQEDRDYFGWSVPARASVILFFIAFVLLRLAPPPLILFGLVDLAGAAWTWQALRSEGTHA
ncbi:MAG: hypothetical protein DWI57_07045 [Chloroflexi bacterium]|nr:MAG: hypothetical protein DWI57_07045 [Chloroflexota bacterium]